MIYGKQTPFGQSKDNEHLPTKFFHKIQFPFCIYTSLSLGLGEMLRKANK